jgi:hypothetical protein
VLVSIFNQYGALNSGPVFDAISQGLFNIGIEYCYNNHDADVAVIWSLLWAGRMAPNKAIFDQFQDSGRAVIVVEVGMISRGETWKISLWRNRQVFWGSEFVEDRAKAIGLEAKPWRQTGRNIVVAAQRTDSEQWRGQPSMIDWINEVVKRIRTVSDRPIIVRPHPRERLSVVQGVAMVTPTKLGGSYDSFDFHTVLSNAHLVVNWSSTPGVESILFGVPSVVGPNSMASVVGAGRLEDIENPRRPDRTEWVRWLAHTEWRLCELQQGWWFKRLLPQ